jgi:hypothetical protein
MTKDTASKYDKPGGEELWRTSIATISASSDRRADGRRKPALHV